MKKFDLEKALAGEPVVTRQGFKAYILNNLNEVKDKGFTPSYPLIGIIQNRVDVYCWTLDGRISILNNDALGDIVGMWQEPRPTVTLTLPCPLKEPQEGMWLITVNNQVIRSSYSENDLNSYQPNWLEQGKYFASEEDAQAWVDALKNNRK